MASMRRVEVRSRWTGLGEASSAVRNRGFESERLTEKGGDGLRHENRFVRVLIYQTLQGSGWLTQRLQNSCAQPLLNGVSVSCKQEVVMKLTNVKSMLMKVATVGLVAGAIALAAPAKAKAQVVVGVGFGYPHPDY